MSAAAENSFRKHRRVFRFGELFRREFIGGVPVKLVSARSENYFHLRSLLTGVLLEKSAISLDENFFKLID